MKKKTQISLIVLLATLLLLAISMPASARQEGDYTCFVRWAAYDVHPEQVVTPLVPGDGEYSVDGNIITRTCRGRIPLGESPYNPHTTLFTLDEMRDYLCAQYDFCEYRHPFIVYGSDPPYVLAHTRYQGEQYESSDWWYRVLDNGNFILEAYFDISE